MRKKKIAQWVLTLLTSTINILYRVVLKKD